MTDTSLGARFRGRLGGGMPTVQELTVADTSFVKGDMVNLETGEVDLVATNDTDIAGMVNETKSGMTTSTTTIEVITDDDATYAFYDANARVIGATLDLAGISGAVTLATSNNIDVIVVADSTASEETVVRIAHGPDTTLPAAP